MVLNKWSQLKHLQLGKLGEFFASIEFIKAGFDVFSTEVDDKGIDLVARKNESEFLDIQVKSIRNHNYVFMRKEVFNPRKNLYLVLVLFEEDKEPSVLLIPSTDWPEKKHSFLAERNYEDKKSKPEWGVDIKKSNIDQIKEIYSFEKQIKR